MWTIILGWVLKSKAIKVGVGAVGGSGLLALIFNLHADITQRIDREVENRKEYIQLVISPLQSEVSNLKDGVNETKVMVRDLHNHLLNKNNSNK